MGACESKKALKEDPKKNRMETLPKLKNEVHGSTTSSSKSQKSLGHAEVTGKKVFKRVESNSKSELAALARNSKERKVNSKKAPLVRSSTEYRSTAVVNKTLHKTSSVSPAPSGAPPKLLNRFGFKAPIVPLKSGDSTDSVNSILSDAKSISDLNLNRAAEENGNFVVTETLRDADDKSDVLSSISQASSGVTSCIAGKVKGNTKLLPQPVRPISFVKYSSARVPANTHAKIKIHQKSVAIHSNENTYIRSSQNHAAVHTNSSCELSSQIKLSTVGLNSDTEYKSVIGTKANLQLRSCDSNKVSSLATKINSLSRPSSGIDKKEISRGIVPGKSTETVKLTNKVDISDAWLRERKMKMKPDPKPSVSFGQKLSEDSKYKEGISGNGVGKEKKDNLTYGAARQKIAPYSRSRFGFGFSTVKTSQTVGKPIVKKTNSGVIQTRVAEIEKHLKDDGGSCKLAKNNTRIVSAPKKITFKPTTLEKLPVMPLTNETIELNKPIYRKLQYTEGKQTCVSSAAPSLSNSEDILVVLSVEKKSRQSSTNGESCEEKYVKDEKQTEKIILNPKDKSTDRHSQNVHSKKYITEKTISTDLSNKKESSTEALHAITENIDKYGNSYSHFAKPVELHKEVIAIPHKNINTIKKSDSLPAHSCDIIKKGCQKTKKNITNINPELRDDKKFFKNTKVECINTFTINEAKKNYLKEEKKVLPLNNATIQNSKDTTEKIKCEVDSSLSISPKVMTSSTESATKSTSSSSRLSGKCTPILGANKAEMEQDFFIEDEISDQPGLMFGETVDLSFLDDDLFGEDVSSSSHLGIQDVRSRAESAATLYSIGAEDLILDYDTDETRNSCRLESDILSPTLVEGDNSAMLVIEESPLQRCISKEGLDAVLVNDNTSVHTKQPISNELPASPQRSSSEISYQKQVDTVDSDCIVLNRSTVQYISQDVATIKSLLLRLRKILNTSEVANPLNGETKASLFLNLGINDQPLKNETPIELVQENIDLKRQMVLMHQKMEEKNKAIRVLQQQLTQALQHNTPLSSSQVSSTMMSPCGISSSVMSSSSESSQSYNAATQTDRSSYKIGGLGVSRTVSVEDGLGPTVSSRGKINGRRSEQRPNQKGPSEVLLT